MSSNVLVFLLAFYSFFSVLSAQPENQPCLPLSPANSAHCIINFATHPLGSSLASFLPATFYLAHVALQTDIAIEEQELRSLIMLTEHRVVSCEQVQEAIARLEKKQKFKELMLYKRTEGDAVFLTFSLTSQWTVSRVQIRGTLLGKDQYRHHYVLEPGEIFDQAKHALGLERVKQALENQGYYNAQVQEELAYDETTKSVMVTIKIDHKTSFTIRDVQVQVRMLEGVMIKDEALSAQRLTKMMRGLLRKNAYSKELLDRSAKKLHEYLVRQGFFNSTIALEQAIDRKKCSVQIILNVGIKNKSVFEFCGNKFFSSSQLLDQVCLFGKSVTLIPPSLLAEEFVALYKKEGFWQAEISWEDDGERIFFFIKEGKRIGIRQVRIIGAEHIAQDVLIKKHFKKLIKAAYFNGDLFKHVLDELGQDYLQQGFWDFSATHYEYLPLDNDSYELVLTLHEGEQRLLTSVSWDTSVCSCADSCLTNYQKLTSPVPFDIRIIKEHKQALTKALHAQGKLYARPQPELEQRAAGTHLHWSFAGSREVVHFGDTIITGNSELPAHIISRELAYEKGDVWDQHKIEKSMARLKRLGVFDTVSVAPEDVAANDVAKTLLVKYVQDSRYEARARLGVQGVNRNIFYFNPEGVSYRAGGSFLVKNPCNRGDGFRADLDFSRYMYDISASYALPWLFSQPIRNEYKVYSSHYDQPLVIGSSKVYYKAEQDGFSLSFSREFGALDADCTVGCEWMEIKPGDVCGGDKYRLAHSLFLNPELINHRYPYLFMQPSIYASSLDNKIQPTRGWLSLISLKAMYAPTFNRSTFFKVLVEQSFYIPWGPLVFAWRGRCGTLVNASFSDINPIERFYLGGAYSVRSYEPDRAPPLNFFKDNQGCMHVVPTGGRSMLNMNSELRFPLYASLSGVVFNDLGILSDKCIQAAIKEHKFVGALGFGLRFNTVVGPLRFDIGWKLNRLDAPPTVRPERSYAWFLALGNAF